MYEIEECYHDGDLDKSLTQALEFIKRIGEDAVRHVYTRNTLVVGWTVDVIYVPKD